MEGSQQKMEGTFEQKQGEDLTKEGERLFGEQERIYPEGGSGDREISELFEKRLEQPEKQEKGMFEKFGELDLGEGKEEIS